MKVQNLRIAISLLTLGAASACSLAVENQAQVQIKFPPQLTAAKSANRSSLSLQAPNLVGFTEPETVGDFTCFGINVTAIDIPVNPLYSTCSNANLPYVGQIAGFVPVTGGTINLTIQSGTRRTFQLFAVQTQASIGCPNITDALIGKFGSSLISNPVELGRTVADVMSDTSINITAAFDPKNPKPMFCPSGVGVPVQLALSGPKNPTTLGCVAYQIQAQDHNGNAAPVPTSLPIALSGFGSGTFFDDNNCTLSIGSQTNIASDSYSKTVYFQGKATSDALTISASAAGLNQANLTVSVGLPTLTFKTLPSSPVIAGSTITPNISVSILDASNQIIPQATTQITIQAFTDSNCKTSATDGATIAAKAGVATFPDLSYIYAGTVYVGALADGLAAICSGGITVSAAAASGLLFINPLALSATAGAAFEGPTADDGTQTPIQVGVYDTYGNLVTTSIDSISLAAYTDANCSNAATSGTLTTQAASAIAGIATFEAISYSAIDSIYIGANAAGLPIACSTSVTIASASPVDIKISANPTSGIVADNTATSTITITLKDSLGNLVSGEQVSVSASDNYTIISNLSVTDRNGQTTFTVSSTHAGKNTITVTDSTAKLSDSVDLAFVAGSLDLDTSSISGPTDSVTADGTTAAAITITLMDKDGNPISGIKPTFTATGSNNTYGACTASDQHGNSTCTMTSKTAEEKTLVLTMKDGKQGNNTGSVNFVGSNKATQLVFMSPLPTTGYAGRALDDVTIDIQDANGNEVSGIADGSINVRLSAYLDSNCTIQAGPSLVQDPATFVPSVSNIIADYGPVVSSSDHTVSFKNVIIPYPGTLGSSGTVYLKAEANNGLSSACSGRISLGQSGPYKLKISGPSHLQAGQCSGEYQTIVYNSTGQKTSVGENDLQVNLETISPGGSGGTFYSDSNCLNTLNNTLAITAKTDFARFWFKSNDTSVFIFSASASFTSASGDYIYLQSGSKEINTLANLATPQPVALQITGPFAVQSTVCSQQFNVTLLNPQGSPQPVPTGGSDVQINLNTLSNSDITFYSDSGCSDDKTLTSLSFSSDQFSANFYAKSSMPGINRIITADNDGYLIGASTSLLVFGNEPAKKLIFVNDHGDYLLKTGKCYNSRGAIGLDENFLPTPLNPDSSFTLTTTPTTNGIGDISFFSDSTCTTSASTGSTTYGAVPLNIMASSASDSALIALTAQNLNATLGSSIADSGPALLAFSSPSPAASTGCTSIAVGTYTGTVDTPTPVTEPTDISLSSSAGEFYSDAYCIELINYVSFASGTQNQIIYFRADQTSADLNARASGMSSTKYTLTQR